MAGYVFIESRDPFSSGDTAFVLETATELKRSGHDVSVFLVQNGVLGARDAAHGSHVPPLIEAGITVLADDFSVRERGLDNDRLHGRVRRCAIDELVDLLVNPNTKAIWH